MKKLLLALSLFVATHAVAQPEMIRWDQKGETPEFWRIYVNSGARTNFFEVPNLVENLDPAGWWFTYFDRSLTVDTLVTVVAVSGGLESNPSNTIEFSAEVDGVVPLERAACYADFDRDGVVGGPDFGFFRSVWQKRCNRVFVP